MTPRARIASTFAAASALVAASHADAWTYGGSIAVGVPCPAAATALEVVREAADLDCSASDTSHLRCVVRGRLVVRNPTDETVHTAVTISGEGAALSVAGAPPSRAVELVVAPRAEVELVMRGDRNAELEANDRVFNGFGEGALGLMHPLLVERRDRTMRVLVTWQRANRCNSAGIPWASVGEATLVTHAPRAWSPTIGWEQRGLCRATRAGLDCLQVEETAEQNVSMSFDAVRPGVFRAGGVTLGLGATTPHGLRARLGYEFGIGRRFMGAASIEGDVAGNLVLTPTVGYVIPLWHVGWWRDAVFPGAVVAWLGAPVGVLPDRRVGVRAQASLVWIFAGLDTAVDYWPVDGRVDVSVMLRVGI